MIKLKNGFSFWILLATLWLHHTTFAQTQGRVGDDPSAVAYFYGHSPTAWLQLSELLMGNSYQSDPERIELEVTGGPFAAFGKVTYFIDSRDGLTIEKIIHNNDVGGHQLKIFDTGAAGNSLDKYIIGVKVSSGYYGIGIRAREISKGKWLTVTSVTEPTTYPNVTPTIKVMPHPLSDGRMRLEGDNAGLWIEAGTTDWFIGRNSGSDLRFYYGGDRVTFTSTGNVGIGTSTPGNYKLAVEGKIGAREVEVHTSTWADFVFEDAYQLRSLREVEQHILEKGHLPEIPSAAEVAKSGINLGEMDAKLLQKIEELTLYIIEQQKKIQTQQQAIDTLTKKIEQLAQKQY